MLKVNIFIPDNVPMPDRVSKNTLRLLHVEAGLRTDPDVTVEVHPLLNPAAADVAVIFGWVKKSNPESWPKQKIIDLFGRERTIVVELGFINRSVYCSMGWGGICGAADYASEDAPADRLALLPKLEPWRKAEVSPRRVLVVGQVPWDVTVQDTNHVEWCQSTTDALCAAGHEVRFRPHPKARGVDYGTPLELTSRFSLEEDLGWASEVVIWNSTTGVESVWAGIPTIAMGPFSMVREVAMPHQHAPFPSRQRWAQEISYSQWSLAEIAAGLPWRRLKAKLGKVKLPAA
jgi:hypothetical protein